MKKAVYILIIFLSLIQFSCSSKTNISASSSKINPLNFDASFSFDVNDTINDKNSPYVMYEDKKSLELLWKEVTSDYIINKKNPEYFFDISLLHTKTIAHQTSFFPTYHSSAIFELKSYDKNHGIINTEIFKAIGVWNDGVGSLSGPVKVSAFNFAKTTRQAIIKLGLIDILSHISNDDFKDKDKPLHKYTHLGAGKKFEFQPQNVIRQNLKDQIDQIKDYKKFECSYHNLLLIPSGRVVKSISVGGSALTPDFWTTSLSGIRVLKMVRKDA